MQDMWRRYNSFCSISGQKHIGAAKEPGVSNIITRGVLPIREINLTANILFL